MGTAAVRNLPTSEVALYSGMFTALILSALIPTQLVYLPAQLAAAVDSVRRGQFVVPSVMQDIHRHKVLLLVSGLIGCALAAPLSLSVGLNVFLLASIGQAALVVISPIQSHVRATLHIAGRHLLAVLVSLTTLFSQLIVILAFLGTIGHSASVALLGFILFATAVANAIGLVVGVFAMRHETVATPVSISLFGRAKYLLSEGLTQGAGYLAVLLVVLFLGSRQAADLEVARVVSSPVQVLLAGLLATFTPDAVRAFTAGAVSRFSRLQKLLILTALGVGMVYAITCSLFSSRLGEILGRSLKPILISGRTATMVAESFNALPAAALLGNSQFKSVYLASIVSFALQLVVLPVALVVLGAIGMPVAQVLAALGRTLVSTTRSREVLQGSAPLS